MDVIKEKKTPIIIAFVQWFITTVFQVDRLFFSYDSINKWLIATKGLYLVFLIVAWCFAFDTYKKIRAGNENYKRAFYIFKVYFSIMLVFLLILWPGTWAWDDLWTLDAISYYDGWHPWQHVITGAYQDVLLQILPFPGGIILLQNVIISICVAFSVTKLETVFKIKRLKYRSLDTLVKILPFLLPPVLMYQFSGYRMGLYVYLELVMLVILIGAMKDKKEWSREYLLLFCFLCVLVATWRTESLFYIPFVCLLILFVKEEVLSNKRKVGCILILVIGFLGVNKFQNWALGNSNYEVISLMRPCAELVRAADSVEDAEILSEIDKVVSLEVIYDNPTANGELLYWSLNVVRPDYTDEDYSSFLKAFVQLSLRYPKVVIAERWNLFLSGSGITGNSFTNVPAAAALFDSENESVIAEAILNRGWIANTPIFETLRKNFINALGMRKSDGTYIDVLQRLIWNTVIPMIVLICAWVKCLIKRKWYLLGICTAICIRIPIVVLTQPSNWLMYELSFYFLGYVCLIYKLLLLWSEKKEWKGKVL